MRKSEKNKKIQNRMKVKMKMKKRMTPTMMKKMKVVKIFNLRKINLQVKNNSQIQIKMMMLKILRMKKMERNMLSILRRSWEA